MRMKFLAMVGLSLAVLAGPLAAAGCSTIAKATGAQSVATYDEKALISAELAYSFVLDTINDAVAIGAVQKAEAEKIVPVLLKAQTALQKARAAYKAGAAADAAVATKDAVTQIAALSVLLQELHLIQRAGG